MKAIFLQTLLLATVSILATNLFGQTRDSLGIDDEPMLNAQESTLLNSFQKNNQDIFDFTGKRIAFVTGGTGGMVIPKSYYFKTFIRPWIERGSAPRCSAVRLTEEEKLKSGGYDAIVLSQVKMFTGKQRRKTITRLRSAAKSG